MAGSDSRLQELESLMWAAACRLPPFPRGVDPGIPVSPDRADRLAHYSIHREAVEALLLEVMGSGEYGQEYPAAVVSYAQRFVESVAKMLRHFDQQPGSFEANFPQWDEDGAWSCIDAVRHLLRGWWLNEGLFLW